MPGAGRVGNPLPLRRARFQLSPLMAYDWLKGVADEYDVIVIGSGLGGLTGANVLAKAGHRVLLLEHHYQFGGLATWFTRKGGHTFDISLHGFPVGMVKSLRKYWTKELADAIVPLKDIRFVNPQMDVWTTFTREDYTRVLVEKFGLDRALVEKFYDHLRSMNFYDHNPETTGQMSGRFFPHVRMSTGCSWSPSPTPTARPPTTRPSPTGLSSPISWVRASTRFAAAPIS